MVEMWKGNIMVRIVAVLILWALVAALVWVWDPFSAMGGMQTWARLGTIIGTVISGIALVLNPLLEDFA